mmetsp:Transcript_11305/g.38632  ORF Transcript_11305/g.38632 Transcript_11305/m.38632 type:complete len:91 (+) Transcript_11305:1286-1558(+)
MCIHSSQACQPCCMPTARTAKVLGEPDSVAGAGAIQADAAASSQLLSQLKVQQRPRGYKVMCFGMDRGSPCRRGILSPDSAAFDERLERD